MAWQLVEEVLDHAPGDLTPAEMLALVVIAEYCKGGSRECSKSTEDLARRMRLKIRGVQDALRRLAENKLDVRVPLGTDKNGKPVYAHRGRVPRFKLPEFPPPEGCPCRSCRPEDAVLTAPSDGRVGPDRTFDPEGHAVANPSGERARRGVPFTPEGHAVADPSGAEGHAVASEGHATACPLPSSVRKKEEEEEPPSVAPACSPEALRVVVGLPWPDGQRPSKAKARELAAKLDTALREDGYTLAELDAHLRGRLPRATKNAVTYLLRALDHGELPIPGLGTELVSSTASEVDFEAEFTAWWAAYPHKRGRRTDAFRAYVKARKGQKVYSTDPARKPVTAEQLLEAVQRFGAEVKRTRCPIDKIPHGSTWLNGDSWTDEDADVRDYEQPKGWWNN